MTTPRVEPEKVTLEPQRRGVRSRWPLAMGMLVVAMGFGIIALLQRERNVNAERERVVAAERAAIAEVQRQDALLEEAAKSDRLAAKESFRTGDKQAALAFLARACRYAPKSDVAARMAFALLKDWRYPQPRYFFGPDDESGLVLARFNHDGSRIVSVDVRGNLCVRETSSGKVLCTFEGERDHVWKLEYSPDDTRILTVSERRERVSREPASQMTLDPKKESVTFYDRWIVRVWDAASGKLLVSLAEEGPTFLNAHFSPDGSRIVTASTWGALLVSDAATGALLLKLRGHDRAIGSVEFSSDGSRILTASRDGTARVWNAATGDLLMTLGGREGDLTAAHFARDARWIVAAAMDGVVTVWDAASGREQVTLTGRKGWSNDAQFSPDGNSLVRTWEKGLEIYETKSGKLLASLEGREMVPRCPEFSRDGLRVAATYGETSAAAWDAASGKLLSVLSGHYQKVDYAQLSSDGSRVLTAGWDSTAAVWDLPAAPSDREDEISNEFFTIAREKAASPPHPATLEESPSWFPDLLNYLAQEEADPEHHSWASDYGPENRELARVSWDEAEKLREKLRAVLRAEAGKKSPYLEVLRKYVSE